MACTWLAGQGLVGAAVNGIARVHAWLLRWAAELVTKVAVILDQVNLLNFTTGAVDAVDPVLHVDHRWARCDSVELDAVREVVLGDVRAHASLQSEGDVARGALWVALVAGNQRSVFLVAGVDEVANIRNVGVAALAAHHSVVEWLVAAVVAAREDGHVGAGCGRGSGGAKELSTADVASLITTFTSARDKRKRLERAGAAIVAESLHCHIDRRDGNKQQHAENEKLHGLDTSVRRGGEHSWTRS